VAWVLARRNWRGKLLVETFIALPLVLPPVATGLLLLRLFGRRGWIGEWLKACGVEVVFTWKAVALALGVMSFPLLAWSARSAFEQVNPRLEEIARTLGAGELRVFFTITLPLAARGVSAGLVLAFARALGEFGATVMVAGNIPGETSTLSLSIYQSVQLGRDSAAYWFLGVSVVLAFGATCLGEWLLHHAKRRR
jgi:molybdate transport system permease protein